MPPGIAELEAQLGPFHGLALARDGVYLDRHRVGTLAELEDSSLVRADLEAGLTWLRARATPRRRIDGVPDRAAISFVIVPPVGTPAITRAFDILGASPWEVVNVRTVTDGVLMPLCTLAWRDLRPQRLPRDADLSVMLTVELRLDGTWIGLSRINEFERAPDFAAIARRLAHEKGSSFFVDRTDLQLAADPSIPAASVLSVLAIACRTFPGTVLVAPADLVSRAPPR